MKEDFPDPVRPKTEIAILVLDDPPESFIYLRIFELFFELSFAPSLLGLGGSARQSWAFDDSKDVSFPRGSSIRSSVVFDRA